MAAATTSPAMDFARRFARNRAAVLGLIVILAVIGLGLFASILYPRPPLRIVGRPELWPFTNGRYWLGTDSLGRDIATIMGFLAGQPAAVYADAFDRREDMVSRVARWRPELRLDAA